jgi:hypothetical protein
MSWVLIGAGVVVVLLVLFLVSLPPGSPKAPDIATQIEDLTKVRLMLEALHLGPLGDETPLAADGKLNIYGVFLGDGRDVHEIARICRSSRTGEGPTAAQVEADDYTNFPYERHAGPVDPAVERVLIWDPTPAEDGSRLVGTTGGAARVVDAEEFARLSGG